MTPTTMHEISDDLRSAIDGAKAIQFHPTRPLFAAWTGGTTFNVYAIYPDGLEETTCFNYSDENGQPADPEKARELMARHFENERAEQSA